MTYKLITAHNSPNYSTRAFYGNHTGVITGITIHHWGERGQTFENVVNFLCRQGGNTSAHVVAETGRVAWIVNADKAAWHSGSGEGNGWTIGVELRPECTADDMVTAAELVRDIRATYGDLPLIPHRQWFNTACPGVWDLVKLDRMARAQPSASIAPPTTKPASKGLTPVEYEEIIRRLERIETRQNVIFEQVSGKEQINTMKLAAKVARDEAAKAK